MSLEADIYKLLSTQFTGQDAPAFTTRVYPAVAPENVVYPCCVYDLSSSEFERDMGGDGLIDEHFYTVMILSRQMQEAEIETELIKTNLHGFRGSSFNAGAVTLDSNIRGIFINAGPSYFNYETKTFTRELDVTIHVSRS